MRYRLTEVNTGIFEDYESRGQAETALDKTIREYLPAYREYMLQQEGNVSIPENELNRMVEAQIRADWIILEPEEIEP